MAAEAIYDCLYLIISKYAATCLFDDTMLNDDEDEVDEHFLFDEQAGGLGRLVARAIYDPSAVRPLTRVTWTCSIMTCLIFENRLVVFATDSRSSHNCTYI